MTLKSFLTYCSRLHTFVAYLKRKFEEHFNIFHCNYWNQLKQVSVTKIEIFVCFSCILNEAIPCDFLFPAKFCLTHSKQIFWIAIDIFFSAGLKFEEIIFLSFKIMNEKTYGKRPQIKHTTLALFLVKWSLQRNLRPLVCTMFEVWIL